MSLNKLIKRVLICFVVLVIGIIMILFLIRLTLHKEIDDVSPLIECSEKWIEQSDILWVIPKFNGTSILELDGWCEEILKLNKEIGMHGVTHEYNEFSITRDKEYIQEGIDIFEKCFGFKPKKFKPSQLEITPENKRLISEMGMKLELESNQLFHKVYHCDDSGRFPNELIDFF